MEPGQDQERLLDDDERRPVGPGLLLRAAREFEALRLVRRDLHAHPELSWQEHRTTGLA